MRTRTEQPTAKLILRLLERDDLTVYELSEELGITPRNLRVYLKLFHEQHVIHIVSFECHGNGPKVPRYGLGDFPDATYPKRRTGAEQQRLNRSRDLWRRISI